MEKLVNEVAKSTTSGLTSSISTIVGTVLGTLFIRRNTRVEEFEKIKAGHYDSVLGELLSSNKMTYYELYKCKNFLHVAELADAMKEDFEKEQAEVSNDFDFDWFMRFFDAVSVISDEEVQKLWARIMSEETTHKGSFSLRTLETLRNLSRNEAVEFQKLAAIALDRSMVFSQMGNVNQSINEGFGFTNSSLRLMEECGLLNGLVVKSDLELDPGESGGLENSGNLLMLKNITNKPLVLSYSAFNLTKVGNELLPIVGRESENSIYLFELGRAIQADNTNLKVSIHAVNGFDSDLEIVTYDEADLLEGYCE